MSAARWPAEDIARLRRCASLGMELTPSLDALLAGNGGAAGDGHITVRRAADGAFEMCGCVGCADDCGSYTRGHGYGPQTIITKDGRRYRTLRGAHPADVPGQSDAWELVR